MIYVINILQYEKEVGQMHTKCNSLFCFLIKVKSSILEYIPSGNVSKDPVLGRICGQLQSFVEAIGHGLLTDDVLPEVRRYAEALHDETLVCGKETIHAALRNVEEQYAENLTGIICRLG